MQGFKGIVAASLTALAAASGQPDPIWAARFSSQATGPPPSDWKTYELRDRHRPVRFTLVQVDGRTVLKAESEAAASGLMKKIRVDPSRYPGLEWSWKIDNIIEPSRWGEKSVDDFAARLFVMFEADKRPFSFLRRWLRRAAGGFRGKALSYVWTHGIERGTIAPSPYTKAVAMVAVESGGERAGAWITERRNVLEDYRKSFGKPPTSIVAIAVMVDTDNTGSKATTYYGDIRFLAEQ